jgi:hypothetical protein
LETFTENQSELTYVLLARAIPKASSGVSAVRIFSTRSGRWPRNCSHIRDREQVIFIQSNTYLECLEKVLGSWIDGPIVRYRVWRELTEIGMWSVRAKENFGSWFMGFSLRFWFGLGGIFFWGCIAGESLSQCQLWHEGAMRVHNMRRSILMPIIPSSRLSVLRQWTYSESRGHLRRGYERKRSRETYRPRGTTSILLQLCRYIV